MQIELVTKCDTNDALKESLVGGPKLRRGSISASGFGQGGGVQIRCDTGVMEKMQEAQAKQMDMMTKFMGAMIEILNEENLYEHRNTFWLRH